MIEPPETQYAETSDGLHIAYQVCGTGPRDVVFVPPGGSHVELAWEVPAVARVFERLASFSRLIQFDHASTGMSDPLGRNEQPSLEGRADEILAVLDAVGTDRATLVANSVSGLEAIFFAATYPDRVASLALDGCYARLSQAPDYPWGIPTRVMEDALARMDRTTGDPRDSGLLYTAPRAMRDPAFLAQYRRYYRAMYTPAALHGTGGLGAFGDVRALLPAIQAPTLVLYRSHDVLAGKPHATYLAENIPNARLVEVTGEENLIFIDSDAALDEIEEFLTGTRFAPASDRVLATVLFTDIVGSTERAGAVGDARWRDLIASHDRAVRRQLDRFRGRQVHTTGDGLLALFDGPGRAIECACAIRAAVGAFDLDVRLGLHTGEIDLVGGDVAGMAVHIGARVAATADAGEVLVSSTVKDLVVGSGFEFADRGEHELRGVPGRWRLFRVEG